MPPVASVNSLYNICSLFINRLVLTAVCNIEQKCGSYMDNLKCQIYVQNVQEYLLTYLHWPMIDSILNSVILPSGFDDNKKIMVMAICMNPDMNYMAPNFKLPPNDDFYILKLGKLSKLVSLDLTMVCTDEILKVVGDTCPLLQEIRIISKMESVTSKCRKQLNALKLKFFVSDEGLQYIHKCQNLRRIIMNTILRSNTGGRKITHDGIRKLLSALPLLQYISYSDLGLVMEEGIGSVERLNLAKVQDYHIKPNHIDLFASLCPNLKELALKVPMTSYDQSMPAQCLNRLAECNLQPLCIDFGNFPFDNQMSYYLHNKGAFLRKFSISYGQDVTARSIVILGLNCPNLKHLDIKILQADPVEDDRVHREKWKLFSGLESLYLVGVKWNPYVIVPLCLNNAKNLNIIGMVNREHRDSVDDLFQSILTQNHFQCLQKMCLHDGFPMKKETMEKFIRMCPNLTRIVLSEKSDLVPCIEQLKLQNNYDLQVRSF